MALVEQLPLTLGALALTSLVVCAGTALQVATGVVLGIVVKRRVREATLHVALRLLLLAMGVSLLWKGISDVTA
ncbi:MAG: hypothetical protein O7A66_10815 [Alphaproteobacteria bacterium]|nr:hypothetical protein [Alphaproteobacteria bacterium]